METTVISFLLGAVVGGATKFFWEKFLPDQITWHRDLRIEREKSLAKYGGPAVRAIHELQQRIYVMLFLRPRQFTSFEADEAEVEYEIESLAFLVAQCCARLEILRGKMEALDYAQLIEKLDPISRNLAGYGRKFQLHRLYQQEIAELMLSATDKGDAYCIGYSKFITTLNAEDTVRSFSRLTLWARSILEHWQKEVVMLVKIQNALVDALEFLDKKNRWIPTSKRARLSASEVVEHLAKEGLIDDNERERLKKQIADEKKAAEK